MYMSYRIAADATLVLHFVFIVFVCFGALLSLRWRWMPYLHVPCAAWGAFVELAGRVCPLTYVENHFRVLAGSSGYQDGFIEHYLLPVVYPGGLTREVQYVLAAAVLVLNVAAYGWLVHRRTWRRGGV